MPKTPITNPLSHFFKVKQAPADHLSAGDRARDQGRWDEAVTHYSEFLASNNSDFGIRVQLGNCLKEAGQFAMALDAYDTAVTVDDKNADLHLQRGHLFKLMGRKSDAILEYGKSFEINSRNNPAFDELLELEDPAQIGMLGSNEARAADSTIEAINIDVTDLIDYLRVNVSLSGIQRVVANIIVHSRTFSTNATACIVRAVIPDYNTMQVYTVRMGLLEALIDLVVGGRGTSHKLSSALDGLLASRSVIRLNAGDTFFIPGAFWIYQRYELLNILRQSGIRVSVFIHDLIQVTNPEFVEPAATTVFRRSIVDVLTVSSYVLTNSRYVAQDVERYLAERMNFELPVMTVPLATELSGAKLDLDAVHQEYVLLAEEEYVLCVGTIEVRKNHLYLIEIWERLIEQTDGPVPNLVLVGKWGWEIDPLRKHLVQSDHLGGRLYIYNAISDNDLAFLYQNCLFTAYPSFAEGWGLPVGESLGYGKPCVASGRTAIPEVGGAFCRYVDPFDLDDGYQVIAGILGDRAALATWTASIVQEFRPKSWQSFAAEIFEVTRGQARDPMLDATGNNLILETGQVATFGNDPLAQLDAKHRRLVTARMSRLSGWHGLEAWGCWANRRRALLRFGTHLPPSTAILAYLHLRTPNGDEDADCTIKIGTSETFFGELTSAPLWVTARGQVGERGTVDITIVSGKGFALRGERELMSAS